MEAPVYPIPGSETSTTHLIAYLLKPRKHRGSSYAPSGYIPFDMLRHQPLDGDLGEVDQKLDNEVFRIE